MRKRKRDATDWATGAVNSLDGDLHWLGMSFGLTTLYQFPSCSYRILARYFP